MSRGALALALVKHQANRAGFELIRELTPGTARWLVGHRLEHRIPTGKRSTESDPDPGSYHNDTNMFAEIDVDVVIRLDSTFYGNIDELTPANRAALQHGTGGPPIYEHGEFKRDVLQRLRPAFPGAVTPGSKALAVAAGGASCKADFLPGAQYRRYHSFSPQRTDDYTVGLCFLDSGGSQVVSYPRHHSVNCTSKQQATNGSLKPCVRIRENARAPMRERGLIDVGAAPSYFLEDLLYNVQHQCFGGSYGNSLAAAMNWLLVSVRAQIARANEEFDLLCDAR